MSTSQMPSLDLRCLLRSDLPEVIRIENRSFSAPWSESEFAEHFRDHNGHGLVAISEGHIVAFAVYTLRATQTHVLSLAVRPEYRRRRAASLIVWRLSEQASQQGREEFLLDWRCGSRAALPFLRSFDFAPVGPGRRQRRFFLMIRLPTRSTRLMTPTIENYEPLRPEKPSLFGCESGAMRRPA